MTVRERTTGTANAGPRRKGSSSPLSGVRGLVPLALVVLAWELLGSPDTPLFPAPSSWPPALVDLWERGRLGPEVVATLRTFFIGLGAATLLGAALGILVGRSRAADRALNPTFEFARAMPPAAMVPIATLLLGFDETMKVTLVTITAIWPVLLNTRSGVRVLDRTLLDTGRTLQLTHATTLRKIYLPALFPSILLGVRVAAPIALVITLLVEILTSVNGVGALIADAQRTFRPARVYGLIMVAGAISLALHIAVTTLESYALRYRPTR
ncbi:MAG TPA: ABC transporter permease [Egibacteraceae bacterium]|nr:ABC transporter permease [Egibacteraceae bacterium]